MPADIYEQDFLMAINVLRKHKMNESNLRNNLPIKYSKEFSIRATSNRETVKYQDAMVSAKYLIQMHARVEEYHILGRNKFNDYLFTMDSLKNRYIDRRDTLIRTGNLTLTVLSVKTEYSEAKYKTSDSKLKFYDSLTIVMSPIIIYNFTTLNLMVTSCRKKKIEIPHGQKIEINEFPPDKLVKDLTLEFAEDIVHHEYHFLDPSFRVDPWSKQTIRPLLIDRMQSLNLRIIKETYNTCVVEIYPDWVITNKTELEFQLEYLTNEFPIDRRSSSFLAIEDERSKNQASMKIKLYDSDNPNESPHKFTAEIDLLDIFTLLKVQKDPRVRDVKDRVEAVNQGLCGRSRGIVEPCCPEKMREADPYRCIEFVLSIHQSPLHEETKELVLNYKYEVINSMNLELELYQAFGKHDLDQLNQQEILLFGLKPGEVSYLFSYGFLPKIYFAVIHLEGKRFVSNRFNCEAATGGSLSLRLKPENGAGEVEYIRVDINNSDYTHELVFKYIDEREVKHPFYIQNRTQYAVKITENEESFKVSPKDRSPFLWSDLIDNAHEIGVEIEGVSKLYSLRQKSEFEPIILRGDNLKRELRTTDKRMLFKRERCKVKWQGMSGEFLVIYDMFSRKLHVKGEDRAASFEVENVENIVKDEEGKIELIFKNKFSNLEFFPSEATQHEWYDIISRDIDNDITDKIFLTIESLDSSMIFFLHTVDISTDSNLKTSRSEYVIENLYISLINNNSQKAEEILLINMEDIEYTEEEKMSKIVESELHANFNIRKSEQCFTIKKMKVNNQLLDAVNPVILSQIKKSKYPFLEFKKQKQNLTEESKAEDEAQIDHYKTNVFFLDEAELMVEASLLPKLLNLKKYVDQINHNYRIEDHNHIKLSADKTKQHKRKQIYINFLEIKPIKMTLSVNFESTEAYHSSKLMNILTMIPAGV
jgi:hypothetical protein